MLLRGPIAGNAAAREQNQRSARRATRCKRGPQAERVSDGSAAFPNGQDWCPQGIDTRYTIGVDRVMVEVGYPHGDGTCPDTQDVIEKAWGHIPEDDYGGCAVRMPRSCTVIRSPNTPFPTPA
jgi:hypothetical protein